MIKYDSLNRCVLFVNPLMTIFILAFSRYYTLFCHYHVNSDFFLFYLSIERINILVRRIMSEVSSSSQHKLHIIGQEEIETHTRRSVKGGDV